MKKVMMLLIAGILIMAGNLYAVDGNLIVEGDATIDGNVGIGTSTPGYKLTVQGANGDGLAILNQNGDVVTLFDRNGAGDGRLRLYNHEGTELIRLVAEGAGFFQGTSVDFKDSSGDSIFRINPDTGNSYFENGNVGIGIVNPSYPLEMASGAHVTPGGVWTDSSSRESKENITDLSTDKALETLKELNPVEYNYKVDKGEKYVGFIAEEVPELVAMEDRKGLSPMDIVAVLTKVVQEQQKVTHEQQKIISGLIEEVKELKREVKLKGSLASVMN